MVKPTYDDSPTAPTRQDPPTFRTRMDAFLAWMPGFKTFVDDANTHIDDQLTLTNDARDKAEEWADAAEDVEVEVGQFSAKHHAAKAAADAVLTAADAEQTALDRVATGADVLSAQTAAAAAGAAAGLPSLAGNAGKALVVNDDADGVLWRVTGGLIPLAKYEITTPVAALEFEIPSGYSEIVLILDDLHGATDNTNLLLRTSTDGGSTWVSSADYESGGGGVRPGVGNTSVVGFVGVNQTSFLLAPNIDVPGLGQSGMIAFSKLGASEQTRLRWNFVGSAMNVDCFSNSGGGYRGASELTDALQFRFSSGNIASGVVHVYGIIGGHA